MSKKNTPTGGKTGDAPHDEVGDRLSRRLDDSTEAYEKVREKGVLKFSDYQDFKTYCANVNEAQTEIQRTYYLDDKEPFKKAVLKLLSLLPHMLQDEAIAEYNESDNLESDPRRRNK